MKKREKNKLEIVRGFLPLFTGTYNTIWEGDEERTLYNVNEDREEKGLTELSSLYDKNFSVNNKAWQDNLSIYYCHEVKNLLKDFVYKIVYTSFHSPKFYNYSTDTIYCDYLLTDENKKSILSYLENNLPEFETFIKDTYTNRSGFISHYSNNYKVWIDSVKDWNFEDEGHQVSSILNFIIQNENEDWEEIDYKVYENVTCNGGDYFDYIIDYDIFLNDDDE